MKNSLTIFAGRGQDDCADMPNTDSRASGFAVIAPASGGHVSNKPSAVTAKTAISGARGERWRPIPGHPGHEVSDLGRVRHGRHILAASPGWDGYPRVAIRQGRIKTSVAVHLLVARAWLGPCPRGHEVDHVRGDKADARASELEYVTHAENMRRWAESWRGARREAA